MARVSTALSFPLHDFVFPRHYRQAVESREAKRTTSRSGFRLYTPSPPGTGHLPVLDILGVAGVPSLDYRIPYTMLRYGQAENTPHRCALAQHSLRYECRSSIPEGVLTGKNTYNAGVAKSVISIIRFLLPLAACETRSPEHQTTGILESKFHYGAIVLHRALCLRWQVCHFKHYARFRTSSTRIKIGTEKCQNL